MKKSTDKPSSLVTNGKILSKVPSKEYKDNFDKIQWSTKPKVLHKDK